MMATKEGYPFCISIDCDGLKWYCNHLIYSGTFNWQASRDAWIRCSKDICTLGQPVVPPCSQNMLWRHTAHWPSSALPSSPHAWFPREEYSSVGCTTSICGQAPVLSHQELVSQGRPWQRSCWQLQTWLKAPLGGAHSLGPSICEQSCSTAVHTITTMV